MRKKLLPVCLFIFISSTQKLLAAYRDEIDDRPAITNRKIEFGFIIEAGTASLFGPMRVSKADSDGISYDDNTNRLTFTANYGAFIGYKISKKLSIQMDITYGHHEFDYIEFDRPKKGKSTDANDSTKSSGDQKPSCIWERISRHGFIFSPKVKYGISEWLDAYAGLRVMLGISQKYGIFLDNTNDKQVIKTTYAAKNTEDFMNKNPHLKEYDSKVQKTAKEQFTDSKNYIVYNQENIKKMISKTDFGASLGLGLHVPNTGLSFYPEFTLWFNPLFSGEFLSKQESLSPTKGLKNSKYKNPLAYTVTMVLRYDIMSIFI